MDAAINALRRRATALQDPASGLASHTRSFWEGYAKALDDLANGVGDWMAARDAAGHDGRLPMALVAPVGSINVGDAIEQPRVFLKFVPDDLCDLERKNERRAEGACEADDPGPAQSLHDAVVDAQRVGASLLSQVEPQNLLFVFGQTREALSQAPLEVPLGHAVTNLLRAGRDGLDAEKSRQTNERHPENRAVIFYHTVHAQHLAPFGLGVQQKAKDGSHCHELSWRDLERLQGRLQQLNHSSSVGQSPWSSALLRQLASVDDHLQQLQHYGRSHELRQAMSTVADMLEALQQLVQFCEPICVVRAQDGADIVHPTFATARAAIAKATGGAA